MGWQLARLGLIACLGALLGIVGGCGFAACQASAD